MGKCYTKMTQHRARKQLFLLSHEISAAMFVCEAEDYFRVAVPKVAVIFGASSRRERGPSPCYPKLRSRLERCEESAAVLVCVRAVDLPRELPGSVSESRWGPPENRLTQPLLFFSLDSMREAALGIHKGLHGIVQKRALSRLGGADLSGAQLQRASEIGALQVRAAEVDSVQDRS